MQNNKKPQVEHTATVKSTRSVKSKIQYLILALLILLASLGTYSNVFAFEYHSLRCRDWPLELRGSYYRQPGDEGYGIHSGSDYSHCQSENPDGTTRDPSTTVGAKLAEIRAENERKMKDFSPSTLGYVFYTPKAYYVTEIPKTHDINSKDLQIRYTVTTNDGLKFIARVMSKDSNGNYADLCSKPASDGWSGIIIGKNKDGREICRTLPSKHVKGYVAGITIEDTAIVLQAPLGKVPEKTLDVIATNIFNSMEPYSVK